MHCKNVETIYKQFYHAMVRGMFTEERDTKEADVDFCRCPLCMLFHVYSGPWKAHNGFRQ